MDILESVQQEVNDSSLNTMQISQSELDTTTQNVESSKTISTAYEIAGVVIESSCESQESFENIDVSMESNNHNSSNVDTNDSIDENQEVNVSNSAMEVVSSETLPDSAASESLLTSTQIDKTEDNVVSSSECDSAGIQKLEGLEDNSKGDNVTQSLDANIITNEVNNLESDTSDLPTFINNMDDSVSFPPADNFPQAETPKVSSKHENTVEEEMTKTIPVTEVSVSEIKTIENVEYTVLPPGENSIFQEDGTLVVEYPLVTISSDNQVEVHENVEFVATSEEIVDTVEEPVKPTEEVELEASTEEMENSFETEEVESLDAEEETQEGEIQIDQQVLPVSTKSEINKNKEVSKETKPPGKPKGRKSTGTIPSHILGHDMEKPVVEVPNGKAIMKPRLGVKIPYRTLSSQIVSNTELCEQIVQRARQKQEALVKVNSSASFAKKLTHRLAQSLSGLNKGATPKREDVINQLKSKVCAEEESLEKKAASKDITSAEIEKKKNQIEIQSVDILDINLELQTGKNAGEVEIAQNIGSDSDLIAILEGDGDEGSPILNVPKPADAVSLDDSSEMKQIEKEISLTEQKTPQVKGKKFFKSRESRPSEIAKEKIEEAKDKETKETKNKPKITPPSRNVNVKAAEEKSSPKEKDIIEFEPQLKPAMVLKTYTRKRKSNDTNTPEPPKKQQIVVAPEPAPVAASPDPKIDFVTPTTPTVYMTKSSRIIKKKVIWDPDEAMPSVRNQTKILSKIEATTKSTPPAKLPKTPLKTVEKKSTNEKEKQAEEPNEKKIVKTAVEDKEKKVIVHDKQIIKKADKIEVVKKVKSPAQVKSPSVNKNASGSPKPTPAQSPKKSFKKKMSEIDKLLMDEGAVNMLYDINNSDEQKRRSSGRSGAGAGASSSSSSSTTSSNGVVDKTQSQLDLINRAMEVKNELTQGSNADASPSPKSLRKKETPAAPSVARKEATMSRKMSKDSSKSSIHSPPPSPAPFNADAGCRIIRRHSSSSFSSNDDYGHMSLGETEEKEKSPRKKSQSEASDPTYVPELDEEAPAPVVAPAAQKPSKERPVKKKAPTSLSTSPESTPKKKTKKNKEMTDDLDADQPQKPVEITVKSEPGIVTGELKTDPTKAFTVIKMNKHYMINLTYSGSESYLTVQLLKDLTVTLKELARNKNCNLVSIHSQGSSFCLGLDYKGLIESNDELRKKRATELSNCVREFLKCLLQFPKVLVAGIKGDCVGLGVTMLPLFDMIIASDSASFCTPYCKLGCAPEAGFLMGNPFQSNHGLASELLFTTTRMKADEAQKRGLVTKLFWPEKFDTEFRSLLARVSNLSKLGLMATKKQLRMLHFNSTESAINSNCKQLIDVWSKDECQENFTNYNAQTFEIDQ